nr:hypothetical protein [Streptomyces sp. UNOB3_S3]
MRGTGSTRCFGAAFSRSRRLGGPAQDSVQLGIEWVALDKIAGLRTLPPCLPTVITDAFAAAPGRGTVYLGDAYA